MCLGDARLAAGDFQGARAALRAAREIDDVSLRATAELTLAEANLRHCEQARALLAEGERLEKTGKSEGEERWLGPARHLGATLCPASASGAAAAEIHGEDGVHPR